MVRDSHSLSLRNASFSHFTSPQSCCIPSPDAPHYGPGAAHHHELCLSAVYPCPNEVIDKSLFMKAKNMHNKDYTLRLYDPRDVIPYLISIFGFLLVLNGRRVVFNPEKLFDSMTSSRVIILCFDEVNTLCGFCFIEPTTVTMHKRRFVEIQTGCGEGVPYATSPRACEVAYVSAMSSIKGVGKDLVDFARYVADFAPDKLLLLDALEGTHAFYKRCKLVCVGKTEGKRSENGMITFGAKASPFTVKTVGGIFNRKPLEYTYPFDVGFNDRLIKLVKLSKKTPDEAVAIAGCRALAYVPTAEETLTKEQQFSEDLLNMDENFKKAADIPITEIKDVVEKKRVNFDEIKPFGKATERDVATIPGLTIDAAFGDAPVDFLDELHGLDLEFPLKRDDVRVDLDVDLRAELMRELITEPQQPKRSFLDVLADVKNKVREASEFAAQLETRIAAVDEANALMESAMAEHAQAVEAARIAQDKAAQLAVRVQQVAAKHKRVSSEVEEMVKRQRVY